MGTMLLSKVRILIASLVAATTVAYPAMAQDAVAKFFTGKSIEIVIGTTVGGGYDTYGRLVARHLGDYVPGKPAIVVKNLPGAGSNKATAYISPQLWWCTMVKFGFLKLLLLLHRKLELSITRLQLIPRQ